MNDPRIAKIIEILEHMRERLALYGCTKTTRDVGIVLSGFHSGCYACGLKRPYALMMDAAEERGWRGSAEAWSLPEMRERGLAEEEMADEMLLIEIGAWKRLDDQIPTES